MDVFTDDGTTKQKCLIFGAWNDFTSNKIVDEAWTSERESGQVTWVTDDSKYRTYYNKYSSPSAVPCG